jgi:hypothetical protein
MNTGKFICAALSSTAMLLAMGMSQTVGASEPYVGTATLCAVDMTGGTQETKGNKGITYTYNLVFLFRIDTDDDLIQGWEVLTSNTKAASQSSGGYNWGEAVLTPDSYAGTGTLVDNFKFPVAQADSISGTYDGTGALEGVVAEYALTPAAPGSLPLDACEDMPWDCIPYDPYTCDPVPPGAAGYFMSGQVTTDE